MSEPAVNFENVSFTYPGAEFPALEHVTLRVEQGERLGVLGPNGGGKSTLLKLALGLLSLQSGRVTLFGLTPQEARRLGMIGYVPQRAELELAMPLSVRQVVEVAATWRRAPWSRAADARERVREALLLAGAEELKEKAVGELSGGQLQRVLIARALVVRPRMLVLDEPMVGIDAVGQERFAQLLDRIHRERGITMLTVTHDVRAIVAGSDRVACLARRLHSHTSPEGLTPRVLAEVFSHDIAGVGGALRGAHIHAHGPEENCPDERRTVAGGDAPRACGHGCGHDHGPHEASTKPDEHRTSGGGA
ncbi:MAG: metal ABC transporter ATP-binding protein [Phycisphaeraceae bacterium]|nr:metal ABC transporter ATP-binding protein [Phycisphaeraceae bacterium]